MRNLQKIGRFVLLMSGAVERFKRAYEEWHLSVLLPMLFVQIIKGVVMFNETLMFNERGILESSLLSLSLVLVTKPHPSTYITT